MELNELIEEWKADSVIDENKLDQASIKNALLHSKYLEYHLLAKLQRRRAKQELENVKKNMWLYYGGKLTKEQMDKLGLKYNPYEGMAKPIKSEMGYMYNADPTVQKYEMKLEMAETMVTATQEILDNIKWKHQTIRNILAHKQFIAGA